MPTPLRPSSIGPLLLLLAACAGKNENLDATAPPEPVAAIEDASGDGDADLPPNCIEDWPESPKAQPVPSIPDITPAVLWTKSVPQAFAGFGYVNNQLVWTGTHLGFSGANKLWILDPEGEVSAIVNLGDVQFVSEPVADTEGTFYFGSVDLYAVRPDGSFKWKKSLGPNVLASVEMTRTSGIALSPDGILYFAATDGFIYAVRSEDGSTIWKRPITAKEFLENGDLPSINTGIGDTIFIDSVPHLRATGEPAGGPLMHDGSKLNAGAGLYSRQRLVGKFSYEPFSHWQTHMFDACGKLLWELRGSSSWLTRLATFEDRLVVQERRGEERYAHIYAHDGEHLLGPAPMPETAQLIGADGTVYATQCADDEDSAMTITAYSPALERLWSLEHGAPCTGNTPALAADGKLYTLRASRDPNGTVVITAIQTASPGLANTSLPGGDHNNRRTRWLGL